MDEAEVSFATRGIGGCDHVPAKGVTIVEPHLNVRIYFPGDLAVGQGGKLAVAEAGPSSVTEVRIVVSATTRVPKVAIGVEPQSMERCLHF